jgi:hypothetical protein
MKEHIHEWLTEKMNTAGMLACGIRAADRNTFTRSHSPQFTPAGLEQACRVLADTFQILNVNRFPSSLVRWVYEGYFLYGSMRADGVCFAVLSRRESDGIQPADLEQIVAEFQALQT